MIKYSFFTIVAALVVLACSSKKTDETKPTGEPEKDTAIQGAAGDHEEPPPPPPEGRPVVTYNEGKAENMTEPQALAKGLTVIDLSNFWVPFIFSERDNPDQERLPNDFRPIFRKLANDWPYESRTMAAAREIVESRIQRAKEAKIRELRDAGMSEEQIKKTLGLEDEDTASETETEGDAGPKEETFEGGLGETDNFLEVYGIPPSLSVLRKRAHEVNKPCLRDIDFSRIARYDGFVSYRNNDTAEAESKKGRTFALKMRREMERLKVEDPLLLMEHKDSKVSGGLARIAMRYEAIVEVQKLLVCEGLYDENAVTTYRKGGLDWKTHTALVEFERKNRVFGWGFIGNDTLDALRKTPSERLYDSFLRVVAERVADAAGIIEDGSVAGEDGNPPKYKDEKGEERSIRNLVAEFTSAVVRHMDLGTPEKVIEFLKQHDDDTLDKLFIAVKLPEKPPYYSDEMEIHAEIDRGDVWYDYPYTNDGKHLGQPRKNMPHTTLYVKWNGQDIPLVKMGTTIGGWRTELGPDGYEYYKYKNSDVGPRVWKDIVAGPVWLPPDTTPTGDLIKTVKYRGRRISVPNYDEFGPWYASAYGLVAAFHVRPVERRNGDMEYFDNGIRSHGSVDYNSILRRFSHGCHRLYNHLAIRLFDFVLRHKKYNRIGEMTAGFSRRFTTDEGDTYTINIDSKGYKYELLNPVPVNVLYGRIRGKQRSPIEHYMPKPNYEYSPDAQFLPAGFVRETTKDAGPPATEKTEPEAKAATETAVKEEVPEEKSPQAE